MVPLLIIAVGPLVINGCKKVDERRTPSAISQVIEEVRQEYCPDKRIAVFNVVGKLQGKRLVLKGEVSSRQAKDALIERLQEAAEGYQLKDEIICLPHPDLEGKIFGVVTVSVANLRKEPDHTAELVNQAIMGAEVKLLKGNDWWYYCQLEDGYLGWMTKGSMAIGDSSFINNWREKNKVIVISNYGVVKSKPNENATPVSDLVRGSILAKLRIEGNWLVVELPDGRRGYVDKDIVEDLKKFKERGPATPEDIVKTAYEFLGCPYLWGGTSSKGFDCSGFTQTVFKLNGILLPRDASQQVKEGKEIAPGENFENLQLGDLVFFGADPNKITHVGIYIGNSRFIHSDVYVRINSFNPKHPDYSEYRRTSFQKAKRILNRGFR